jgi:ankyrin repeat protein
MEGNENMSIFLISVSENLEVQDAKGFTPLHLTVFQSAYKIAKHLVMKGASRKARCNYGQSPFELAKSRGCSDMFKVLVRFR